MKRLAKIGLCFLALVIVASCLIDRHAVSALFSESAPVLASDSGERSVTLKKGDVVAFGRYLQEPILWDVVDVTDNGAVLVSHNVLCFKAYCAGDDTFPLGRASAEASTLSQWLNSEATNVSYTAAPDADHVYQGINPYADEPGFLCDDNFGKAEKACLCSAVFIPTKAQFSAYYTKENRVKTPTASAVEADRSPFLRLTGSGVWYWTSTENHQSRMSVVAATGYGTFYKSPAYDGTMGVVPAVKIQQTVLCADAGSGTKAAPYIVKGVSA